MAKQVTIDKPVIVETGTGSIAYLTSRVNNKVVGIPILSSSSNNIALIQPTLNMRLHNATLYTADEVTPYRTAGGDEIGIAVIIGGREYAFPIFQVPENTLDNVTVNFNETTYVIGMDSVKSENDISLSMVISINDENYAIPLFSFEKIYDIQTGKTADWEDVKPKPPFGPRPSPGVPVPGGASEAEVANDTFPMPPPDPNHTDFDKDHPLVVTPEDPPARFFDAMYDDPMRLYRPYNLPSGVRPPIPRTYGEQLRDVIKTMISVGKPTVDFGSDYGSTFLNNKITAYSDLIQRIKMQFGWPTVQIDLCDENIAEFIDQAIERYTKYAGYTDEYLVFNTRLYKRGIGLRMDKLFSMTQEMRNHSYEGNEIDMDYDIQNYRKVLDCFSVEPGVSKGINVLFSMESALAQQTYFSFLMGAQGCGFDLTTWTAIKSFIDTRRKVLSLDVYFRFDPQTQYLRLLPEPKLMEPYLGLVGCYVEKPIRELINEPWIFEYATALALVAVGRLRSKYSFSMLGGATITGDQLLNQGETKKKELEEMLWKGVGWTTNSPPMFFCS